MERAEEVQEHYDLSISYLEASRVCLDNGLFEPALFNCLHALELSVKAILIPKVDGVINTHNVGGLLGKHYRKILGEMKCRQINRILIQYNVPRYPGIELPTQDEIKDTIYLIEKLVMVDLKELIDEYMILDE